MHPTTRYLLPRCPNDPLDLLPVSGSTNGSKSDSGPASWLPPHQRIRCSYSVRVAQVSLNYKLPVTAADKQVMLRQCGVWTGGTNNSTSRIRLLLGAGP